MTTNCVLPPELDDKQLLSYLDDPNANPETAHHLEQCPYCRGRAENLELLQKRLATRLYRATCPSSMELGEFHLRMLPASQMLLTSAHVRACPHCRQEVKQLESFLGSSPAPNRMERVNVFLAELTHSGNQAPAFGEVRGVGDAPLQYQADDISIILGIQDDMEHPGSKMLRGLIPGLSLRGFTVEIYQGETLVTSTVVDEISSFMFDQLPPGLYDLVLPSHGVEVRIPSVIV